MRVLFFLYSSSFITFLSTSDARGFTDTRLLLVTVSSSLSSIIDSIALSRSYKEPSILCWLLPKVRFIMTPDPLPIFDLRGFSVASLDRFPKLSK